MRCTPGRLPTPAPTTSGPTTTGNDSTSTSLRCLTSATCTRRASSNFFGAALAVAEEPTTADRAADPPPRDPRHRTPAMITYTARMHRSPVPVEEIAAACIDRLELMLTRLVRDRGAIAPGGSIDVPFDDFMADEVGG